MEKWRLPRKLKKKLNKEMWFVESTSCKDCKQIIWPGLSEEHYKLYIEAKKAGKPVNFWDYIVG
jgi:hypothetical protein